MRRRSSVRRGEPPGPFDASAATPPVVHLPEQLRGLQTNHLTFGPTLCGQASTIGIPHAPRLPCTELAKTNNSASVLDRGRRHVAGDEAYLSVGSTHAPGVGCVEGVEISQASREVPVADGVG